MPPMAKMARRRNGRDEGFGLAAPATPKPRSVSAPAASEGLLPSVAAAPAAARPPPLPHHLSGHWVGTMTPQQSQQCADASKRGSMEEGVPIELQVVAVISSQATPSAFGAMLPFYLGVGREQGKSSDGHRPPSTKGNATLGAQEFGGNKVDSSLALDGKWDHEHNRLTMTTVATWRRDHPADPEPTTPPHPRVALSGRLMHREDTGWVWSGEATVEGCPLLVFALVLQPDEVMESGGVPKVYPLSGLWLGSCAPAADLEPFALPTNPVRWALSLIPPPAAARTGTPWAALGGGVFNDSGDVQGQPVLRFALDGTYEPAAAAPKAQAAQNTAPRPDGHQTDPTENSLSSETGTAPAGAAAVSCTDLTATTEILEDCKGTQAQPPNSHDVAAGAADPKEPHAHLDGPAAAALVNPPHCVPPDETALGRVRLTKRYEQCRETDGFVVRYEGWMTRDSTGAVWLRGVWQNLNDISYGAVVARRELAPKGDTLQIVLCDGCGCAINPGVVRMVCSACPAGGFSVCESCAADPPHPVVLAHRGISTSEDSELQTATDTAENDPPTTDADGTTQGNSLAPINPHSRPLVPETLLATQRIDARTSSELLLKAFVTFADRPLLGARRVPLDSNPSNTTSAPGIHSSSGSSVANDPGFEWISYGEVGQMCADFAAALPLQSPDERSSRGTPPRAVLVVTRTSIDHCVALLGTLLAGVTVVPLTATADEDTIRIVAAKTAPTVVICDRAVHSTVLSGLRVANVTPALVHVGTLGPLCQRGREVRLRRTHSVATTGDVSDAGASERAPEARAELRVGDGVYGGAGVGGITTRRSLDDVAAILFTSGSTGTPKGAIFTEDRVVPTGPITTLHPFVRLDFEPFDPTLCLSLLQTVRCGGKRGICQSLDRVMTDLAAVRPTHMGATPVFWNLLHQEYTAAVDAALAAAARDGEPLTLVRAQAVAAKAVRGILGNRCKVGSVGGAPVASAVFKFVREVLGVDLVNTYGTRETGGITCDHVVYPGIKVRVESVPEMGYLDSDTPARGEILASSPRLIAEQSADGSAVGGYFGAPDATADNFVTLDDGRLYFKTGDIGELWTEGGKTMLKVIDRRKFVFKLAQGDWISPSKVENILESCPLVAQALVVGRPSARNVVAILIPTTSLTDATRADPLDPSAVKAFARQVATFCRHSHARPCEVPAAVHIESTPWTPGSGLTANLKKARRFLHHRYAADIDRLYASIGQGGVEDSAETNASSHHLVGLPDSTQDSAAAPPASSLSAELHDLLARVIPCLPTDLGAQETTVADLGVDSLGAGRLVGLLAERGVALTIEGLATYSIAHIDDLLQSAANGVHFDPVDVAIDWASEWRLGSYHLPPSRPEAWGPVAGGCDESADNRHSDLPCRVLLTGATGFLGPFLLAHLLARCGDACDEVVCLVRGATAAACMDRLREGVEQAGLWRDAASHWAKVQALPSSLQSDLGLTKAERDRITSNCRLVIVHNGARVSHLQPYAALKGPNVEGTAGLIKLALECVTPPVFHFVSSVSALPVGEAGEERIYALSPKEMAARDGYGQTKAVGERLLFCAAKAYGMPIVIHRPSVITGSSVSGVSNTHDFENHLLRACVLAGKAVEPTSFSLGWICVDTVADFIAGVAATPTRAGKLEEHPKHEAAAAQTHQARSAEGDRSRVDVYHLNGVGPDLSTCVAELRRAGHTIEATKPEAWRGVVESLPLDERLEPYRAMLAGIRWPEPGLVSVSHTNHRARSVAKELGCPGFERACSPDVIAAIVAHMREVGFFP